MIFFSNKTRPFDHGPYPLERLKRDATIIDREGGLPKRSRPSVDTVSESGPLSAALDKYHGLYRSLGKLDELPPKAPVPDDLHRRMVDIKGAGYFLDVAHVGICEMPATAWLADVDMQGHSHAIAIVQAHGRLPEEENLAFEWINGLGQKAASLRAFEVAIAIASHIQYMGFAAQAHDRSTGDVDLDRLAVLAGVALRKGDGIINPFLEDKFAVAVVTTCTSQCIRTSSFGLHRSNAATAASWSACHCSVLTAFPGRTARIAAHLARTAGSFNNSPTVSPAGANMMMTSSPPL